eukprot:bmy_09921T0
MERQLRAATHGTRKVTGSEITGTKKPMVHLRPVSSAALLLGRWMEEKGWCGSFKKKACLLSPSFCPHVGLFPAVTKCTVWLNQPQWLQEELSSLLGRNSSC